MDGEITVDLPSSLSLDSVEASEFFDATVANAYLDVMRLRSQAYSALYGYAGKDCTPFSNVSFFDHGLDTPLSQAHLDKIHEFHLGLTNWERNNSPALRIAHHSNGAVSNLTRTTGMLYLTYYQVFIQFKYSLPGYLRLLIELIVHFGHTSSCCRSRTQPLF